MDIAALGLEVRSDGVVVASDRLKKFEQDAGRAERATDAMARAMRALTPLLTAAGAALGVSALIRYANTWTDLTSRVANAVGGQEAAINVMGRLATMARRTYSSLGQTADSFLLNATALKELGYSTEQQLDLTESLNNALVISGAKGERATTVLNAWSKAMSLGKLSGENLNTVLSMGDRVTKALADSMGVSTLELRKMGAEGKITTDKMYGMTSQLQKLRDEADAMPATIGDAFLLIGNSLLEFVGRVDKAVGTSSTISEALIGVADAIKGAIEPTIQAAKILSENFERLTFWAGSYVTLMGVQYVVAAGAATVATGALSLALRGLRFAIAGTGFGVLAIILGDVTMKLYDAATATDGLGDSIEKVEQPANKLFTFLKNGSDAIGATFDALTSGIAAGFMAMFATVYEYYAKFVNLIRAGLRSVGASNLLGLSGSEGDMDETWATEKYLELAAEAAEAGDLAAKRWAAAFGARVPELVDVDGIVGGLTTKMFDGENAVADMFKSMRGDNDNGNKPLALLDPKALKEAEKAAQQLAETYRKMMDDVAPLLQAANDPLVELQSNMDKLGALLNAGQISWEQYGEAVNRANLLAASSVLGSVGQITGILSGMFEDNKLLAAANAAVNTAEGVTKALAQGGMFAWPTAIAIGAAGAAQIATIMSAKPGSSRVASVGSGAAPAAPVAQQGSSINLTIRGSGMMNVDEFAEQLTKGIADGGHQSLINVIRAA